ncbi:hypothetical protein PVAP13_7NG052000 [Panicum virgatum]|nr:hypothetical protein PVAP13_7NG052000 [Panicum virgatum]
MSISSSGAFSPPRPHSRSAPTLPFGSLKICTDADHLLPLETSFSPAATTSVALAHHPVNAWTASMMPWTSGSPLLQGHAATGAPDLLGPGSHLGLGA